MPELAVGPQAPKKDYFPPVKGGLEGQRLSKNPFK